ncbi:MAG: hypothetical protein D6B25_18810 [Desulfobulbaceae bacterium]|nr:MAG: hypothetical protein D6B25_18810 [Desulfobulbaceae bacterium]
MKELFDRIMDFLDSTKLPAQVAEVDYMGLFTNPWFLVPFVALIAYFIWKQKWRDIIFVVIFIGIWWVSGTQYMSELVIDDEVQIDKVLPVLFGGAIVLGVVIYIIFGRSD